MLLRRESGVAAEIKYVNIFYEKYEMMVGEREKIIVTVISTLLYSLAINLFVVPAGIYCGGLFGMCQVVRTLLVEYFDLNLHFDIASLLYYIGNIPILIYAWLRISRGFLIKTLVCLSVMSVALSVIPITPLLPDDKLASCIIGGISSGIGSGYYLRMGASGGGIDIIALAMVKKNRGGGVGRISLIANAMLFLCCGFLFKLEVVIYSMIYTAIFSFVVDRVYTQNINVEVKIITKDSSRLLEKAIINELGRGVTEWYGMGAYTGNESRVLYVIASKYELSQLKAITKKYDPGAFVVVSENVSVYGNYLKKM